MPGRRVPAQRRTETYHAFHVVYKDSAPHGNFTALALPVYTNDVYIFRIMPFTGIWTLRCQGCKCEFSLELKPGDQLAEFARSYSCPHCNKSPEAHTPSDKALDTWHHVIGFRTTKK